MWPIINFFIKVNLLFMIALIFPSSSKFPESFFFDWKNSTSCCLPSISYWLLVSRFIPFAIRRKFRWTFPICSAKILLYFKIRFKMACALKPKYLQILTITSLIWLVMQEIIETTMIHEMSVTFIMWTSDYMYLFLLISIINLFFNGWTK